MIRLDDGTIASLDFREKAPGLADRDMYLDAKGRLNSKQWSTHSNLASGVPGTVDGMFRLHDKFGSLPMSELIQPSYRFGQKWLCINCLGS